MSLADFINQAGKLAQHVTEISYGFNKSTELKELLQASRDTGMEHITRLVQAMSPEELDGYESEFLQLVAYGIHEPSDKIRALELYAWLKLLETKKYSAFRGFPLQGN